MTSPLPKSAKAPSISFDDQLFEVDAKPRPIQSFREFACIVYAMEGRGKSTFLKSVMDAWGPESIVAIDIEQRLWQLGVPRVYLPDLYEVPEQDHYAHLLTYWDILLKRAEQHAAPFSEKCHVIAVDTFNHWYTMIHAADLARRMIPKDIPRDKWKYEFQWYSNLYDDVLRRWRRMVKLVNYGYSVIFNCHVRLEEKKINGETANIYVPILPPALTNVVNQEVHTIFYLQASDGSMPNYFLTTPLNDTIPAKDQTGAFPRRLWPTWAAIDACMNGRDWKEYKPKDLHFEVKKEGDKR